MTKTTSLSDKASDILEDLESYFKARPTLAEYLPLMVGTITMTLVSRRAAVKALVVIAEKRGLVLTRKEAKAIVSGVTAATFLVARQARSATVNFDNFERARLAYEAEAKDLKAKTPSL